MLWKWLRAASNSLFTFRSKHKIPLPSLIDSLEWVSAWLSGWGGTEMGHRTTCCVVHAYNLSTLEVKAKG